MKVTKADHEKALAKLRDWFPKGSTVYTILRHVSRSGMQREIGVVALVVGEDGSLSALHPNYATSDVLGVPVNKKGNGVKVGGCGMDMGAHLVSELSQALHDDWRALRHEWL